MVDYNAVSEEFRKVIEKISKSYKKENNNDSIGGKVTHPTIIFYIVILIFNS